VRTEPGLELGPGEDPGGGHGVASGGGLAQASVPWGTSMIRGSAS
jgi:hypothetical protein